MTADTGRTGRDARRVGVPEATVGRLPLYHRVLVDLADSGVDTVSSDGVAPCWVVITRDGRYAFVVNTGGGAPPATVARYGLTPAGDLSLLGITGENNTNGDQFARTDEVLSRDGRYLFVLNPGIMGNISQIDIYRVSGGDLTLVGNTPPNGPAGMSGLAARG